MIMLDHAHTINATKSILKFIKKFNKGRIITVVGCAGNRYKNKRHLIGKIVNKYSDIIIYTEDDPRWENVEDIILEMKNFFGKKNEYYEIINRDLAIEKAISIAKKDDIILILGRGRDEIMHLKDKDIIFNDYDVVMQKLKKYKYQ